MLGEAQLDILAYLKLEPVTMNNHHHGLLLHVSLDVHGYCVVSHSSNLYK